MPTLVAFQNPVLETVLPWTGWLIFQVLFMLGCWHEWYYREDKAERKNLLWGTILSTIVCAVVFAAFLLDLARFVANREKFETIALMEHVLDWIGVVVLPLWIIWIVQWVVINIRKTGWKTSTRESVSREKREG